MMSEQRDEMAAKLASLGVPQNVIVYVLGLGGIGWFEFAFRTSFIAVMVAGFAAGGLWMWPFLEALTIHNAIEHARYAGGELYHANFGVSLVLAFFGWICVAGWLVGVGFTSTPRLRANMLIANARMSNGPIERWAMSTALKRVAGESDPEAYVRRWNALSLWIALLIGAVVLTISAFAVVRDVNTHDILTRSAYIRSPFFPWVATEPRLWRDAVEVEVGCNHVEGRNSYDTIVYEVKFADGASVDVALGTPWRGLWIDHVELIDSELRDAQAPFRRWSWLNRHPLHPACLAAMHDSAGNQYSRIEHLLRIGELPDR